MAHLTPRTIQKKEFYKEHFYKHPIALQRTVERAREKSIESNRSRSRSGSAGVRNCGGGSSNVTPRTPKITLDDLGIPTALPDIEHSVTLRRLTTAENKSQLRNIFIKGFKYGYVFQCGIYAMNLFFAKKAKKTDININNNNNNVNGASTVAVTAATEAPNLISKLLKVFLTKQHFVLGTVFGLTRIINTFTLKSQFRQVEDKKSHEMKKEITGGQMFRCIGCGLLSGLCFKGMDTETRNWISLNILVYAGYDYYRLVLRSPNTTKNNYSTDHNYNQKNNTTAANDTNNTNSSNNNSENNDEKQSNISNFMNIIKENTDEMETSEDDEYLSDLDTLVSDDDFDLDTSPEPDPSTPMSPKLMRRRSRKSRLRKKSKTSLSTPTSDSGSDTRTPRTPYTPITPVTPGTPGLPEIPEKPSKSRSKTQKEKDGEKDKKKATSRNNSLLNRVGLSQQKMNRFVQWMDDHSARIMLGFIFGTIAYGLFTAPHLLDRGYYKTAIKWSDLNENDINKIFREPSNKIPAEFVNCCPNLHESYSCTKAHLMSVFKDLSKFRHFKMYATVHFGSLLFSVKFYKLLFNLIKKYIKIIQNLLFPSPIQRLNASRQSQEIFFENYNSNSNSNYNDKESFDKGETGEKSNIPSLSPDEESKDSKECKDGSDEMLVEPPPPKSVETKIFNIIKHKFIASTRSMLFLIFNTRLSALIMCWLRWLLQGKMGIMRSNFGIIAGIASCIGGIISSLFETKNRAISYNIYCILHIFKMIGRGVNLKYFNFFSKMKSEYNFDIQQWWSVFIFGFSFILWDFSRLKIESKKKPIWYARWSCVRGFKDERLKSWMLQYFL